MKCPLCRNVIESDWTDFYCRTHQSPHKAFRCSHCYLIFKDPLISLSVGEEKKRYDQHHNDPYDPRYRQFLNKALTPLLSFLCSPAKGLDFGSGPGPTLSLMLEEKGFEVDNYDPFYAPHHHLLKQKNTYDFITATEVFEHLQQPGLELIKLLTILKDSGLLCLMTEFYPAGIDFNQWWYKDDPTHIVFYTPTTFEWIAEQFQLSLIYLKNNCVIMKKED